MFKNFLISPGIRSDFMGTLPTPEGVTVTMLWAEQLLQVA